MTSLRTLLDERSVLLLDGAMGTELFRRGLDSGAAPEQWNVDQPDRVEDVHRAYIEAGSDIVLTNSFGGTHFRLALHSLQDRVVELNAAAARIARRAADAAARPVLVAGSMGPTGELLQPMGSMTPEQCHDAFAEQARGLGEGGADVLWIETMSSVAEVEHAVSGARSASDLPIMATLSFDSAGRTMMGVSGTDAAALARRLGLVGVGANCGNNLADTEAAVSQMLTAEPDLVAISKGNAGIPVWRGADLHYNGTPEVMAAYAHRARQRGVRLIGSCCGSTPEHIAAMRRVLDGVDPVPEVDLGEATAATNGRRRTRRRSA